MGAPRLTPAASSIGPDTDIPDKVYFKIGEVAHLVGVEPHVLRYWEREVAAIRPGKSTSNQRRYRRRDVELFREVRRLLYYEKYTLAGARRRLQGGDPILGSQTFAEADDREPEFDMPDLLSDVLNDPELMLLLQQEPVASEPPPVPAEPAVEPPPAALAATSKAAPPGARGRQVAPQPLPAQKKRRERLRQGLRDLIRLAGEQP